MDARIVGLSSGVFHVFADFSSFSWSHHATQNNLASRRCTWAHHTAARVRTVFTSTNPAKTPLANRRLLRASPYQATERPPALAGRFPGTPDERREVRNTRQDLIKSPGKPTEHALDRKTLVKAIRAPLHQFGLALSAGTFQKLLEEECKARAERAERALRALWSAQLHVFHACRTCFACALGWQINP